MLGFNVPERTLNVTGTITLTSGTVINIEPRNIVNYSISERIASNGFALGETQSAAYTLEIDNTEHKLKASDLEGAIVRCEISMVRGISISIPVPFGVWQVTSANALEQSVTISMSGGDALEFNFDAKFLKTDQTAAANANSTHGSLLQYVCDKAGVTLSTTEFLHSTVKLTGDEKWSDDVTLRDVVSYIAAAAGGFARIARDGNLEIVGYGNTQNVGTITPDTYITLDEGDGSAFDFRRLSVKYVGEDNYAYYPITPLIAKPGNTLQVVDNPLFNYDIMVTVATDLSAMKSEPTRMEWIGDPLLRLGDTVTIVDMSNNEREIIVNSQTITYDGGMYAITQCQLPKRNEQSSGFKPTHWMPIVNKGDGSDDDTILQSMPTYKGVWDSAVAYSMLDVVSSMDKHSVYMALRDVPAGIELDNDTYWGEMVDVSDGVISNIMYVGNANDGGANTLKIIMGDGTTKEFSVYNGKKGSPGTPGKSITIESVAMSEASGGNNVVTFSDGTTMTVKNGNDGNDGAAGKRGLSVFRITTGPSAYTTTTPGGFTPKYRVALSTVKTQGKTDDVVVGDTVIYSYYTYPVGYVDANYVYLGTRVSIRGSTGAAGKTAYQYAQDGGYTGTEEEFAEKLAGEMLEPIDGDIPKVFLSGSEFSSMTTDKNEVNMELEYRSQTDNFHAHIAIKYQGNSSLSYPKKNFTVKLFDDAAHESKQTHLFRDWKYAKNKFVLKANYIDHSHARNIVCANLWNEIVASRSDYASIPEELRNTPKNGAIDGFPIKLYVNGTYQGVYTWNIGKDDWMWGMDEDNANHILLCIENNSDGVFKLRPYNFRAVWDGASAYFEAEIGTKEAAKTPINNLISFVMNNNGAAFRNGIGAYLDVQSAIDYYIHQYVICGLDGLAKNLLLGTYDGKKWYCGAYDMDSTFGLQWAGKSFVAATYKCPEDYQEPFSLLWERFEENYWPEIKARYTELRSTVFSVGNMFTHFERFIDSIGSDLYAEDLEIFTSIPSGSTNNIKQLRNFIRDRLAYCDAKIANGTPATAVTLNKTLLEFNAIGNTTTLTATATPSNHTDEVMWITSNAAIATVTNGVVKAVADGECEIRAKCGSGYAVCNVKVATAVEPEEPTYTNLVPTSIDTNGTVFNGTGYKDDARLSSSGGVSGTALPESVVTGFIPAKKTDIVRMKGAQWLGMTAAHPGHHYYFIWYDSNKTKVGDTTDAWYSAGNAPELSIEFDATTGVTTFNFSGANLANTAYFRLNAYGKGANMIVTVNEEIN